MVEVAESAKKAKNFTNYESYVIQNPGTTIHINNPDPDEIAQMKSLLKN